MVYMFAAMMSFGLTAFGIMLIAQMLRRSGAAILYAMAGEMPGGLVTRQPRVRRAIRVRTARLPAAPLRAAA